MRTPQTNWILLLVLCGAALAAAGVEAASPGAALTAVEAEPGGDQ